MGELLGRLGELIVEAVYSLGYVGIGLLIALENLFPPIPSEAVLPLAGYLVSTQRFSFPIVVLAATIGSVVSALIIYQLGSWLGEERLRALVGRYGRYMLLKEADVQRASDWFDRHGGKAVFFGRLVPGVRSLISLPAGIVRMPVGSFIIYTALGSAGWNAALVGLGWALGSRWSVITEYYDLAQYAVILAVGAALLRFLFRRWASRRKRNAYSS